MRRPETALATKTALATTIVALALATAAALAIATPAAPAAPARLQVRVFAHVPAPGYPANAILANGTVYAGTFHSFSSPSDTGPSKVFAFNKHGALVRTYTVKGQTAGAAHGVQVSTVDRSGILYLLDQAPARIIKLDPRTGKQSTWATFASVPACPTGKPNGSCTLGMGSNPPEPDFSAWGHDGSLYVTDYNQSLIWRVPPTGGKARVWLTDKRFNGVIVGPAGIELMPDGRTLMLTTGGGGTDPSTGKLYTLPINPDGTPGALRQRWESASAEAPDGFAIARSGDVYLSLVGPSGNALVELSPSYKQIARVPANSIANQAQPIPFDAPGSVAFLGDHVIVANQAAIDNKTKNMALLEVNVAEPGLALSLPPRQRLRYRLTVTPHRATPLHRTRFHFTALRLGARNRRPVSNAMIHFAGRTVRTRNGAATIVVAIRHPGRYRARLTIRGRLVATAIVRVGTTRRKR